MSWRSEVVQTIAEVRDGLALIREALRQDRKAA
jgi:hypothetical protein